MTKNADAALAIPTDARVLGTPTGRCIPTASRRIGHEQRLKVWRAKDRRVGGDVVADVVGGGR